MDQRSTAVANTGAGTVLENLYPIVEIAANGNLPAMVLKPNQEVQQSLAGVVQNQAIVLYALPASSQLAVIELTVVAFTPAGRHMRKVVVAGTDIQYPASSTSAAAVFAIQRTGDNVEFKYLHSVAGSVDINAIVTAVQEA
jgi:hypothetical protein